VTDHSQFSGLYAEKLSQLLRDGGQWPDVVRRLELTKIVDSVGDDAINIDLVLADDNATPERLRELAAFSAAVRRVMKDWEPDLFTYLRMVEESSEAGAGTAK